MSARGSMIRVDFAMLDQLARHLGVIEAALADDAGPFGNDTSGIEHRGLNNALNNFDDRWSRKRRSIRSGVKTIADSIEKVESAFRQADQDLAAALEGSGSTDGGRSAGGGGGGGGGSGW